MVGKVCRDSKEEHVPAQRGLLKKMVGEVRWWRINLRTTSGIADFAEWVNPVVHG